MSTIVPVVGDRKVYFIENDNLFDQIDDASRELMEEYLKKVPLSFTFPGMVDGKAYIIATVNLPRGTPISNLPTEFKKFPVLIDYGTMKVSTASDTYHKYQNLKPRISISNSKLDGRCTLGAFFKTTKQPDKKYLLTVNNGIGEVVDSIIQPGKIDKDNLIKYYCTNITKYEDLRIDASGRLLDFVFCEVDSKYEALVINKLYQSNIKIEDIQFTIYYKVESNILVQKVDRAIEHIFGKMKNRISYILVTNTFEVDTYAKMLLIIHDKSSNFGAVRDSNALVYDQDSLF
ncbi:hypothetical protein Glove_309g86 [Diversispora epigaea]|uniref:Uncharacterized protein n=1 Tax=Diversispora epigaea TaxID=1348612 RepID=A0A397HSW1_9GLOM|nr:hypothetical protein Glove_309g86 [Diversispora epigaea]